MEIITNDEKRDPASDDLDLLYGCRAIGEALGLTVHQTDHLYRTGKIPTFRIGGKVCSRRSVLRAWLDKQLAAEPS